MPTERYARNFLEAVIFRIDYDSVELGQLNRFYSKVQEKFPSQTTSKAAQDNITFDAATGKATATRQEISIWQFRDTSQMKLLEVAADHLYLQYGKYGDSEELLADISSVIDPFITDFKLKTINRVGLRYINRITLSEPDLLDWSKYVASHLRGGLDFAKEISSEVIRDQGQLIMRSADADILFTYGPWNPDFPASVLRKEFILDIDCYSRFPVDPSDTPLGDAAKVFSERATAVFENAITEDMREILRKED